MTLEVSNVRTLAAFAFVIVYLTSPITLRAQAPAAQQPSLEHRLNDQLRRQAAFLPAIGLTTFFGKLSTPLSELSSANTNAWSIGPRASGPIFHFGGLRARKRQAIANWEQATAQYRQTALGAFRDVSDALISRENYEAIRSELIKAVQENQEAVRLARMRYLEGLSSYIDVLDALQRLYPAQLALAQIEVNRRLVIIQLYKALGGGWNLSDTQFRTACGSPGVQCKQP